LSVSFISAFICAVISIDLRVILRKILPTLRDGKTSRGKIATPIRVSRQSSEIITIRVDTSVITLVTRLTSVPVTALCAPDTSLLRRDISSPVLVCVKKRKLIRCK